MLLSLVSRRVPALGLVAGVLACGALSALNGAEPIVTAKHWDLSSAYRETTATRTRVCLNGFWQFRPVPDDADATALGGGAWGFLKVPGGFRRCFNLYGADGKFLPYPKQEEMWKAPYGVYRRTIFLDRALEKRRVFLLFEALMDRGVLYVNGKRLKKLEPYYNVSYAKVDFTALARFGAENEIRVLAVPRPKLASWKRQGGLAGDVWLISEPKGPALKDWFLRTSVRKKRLNVSFEVDGAGAAADAKWTLRGAVQTADGQKTLFTLPPQPIRIAKQQRRVKQAFDLAPHWNEIELWNFEHPKLYRVALQLVRGGKLLDEIVERFGFCETAVRGKDLLWNGRPIHRRGSYRVNETFSAAGRQDAYLDRRNVREFFRLYKKAGFNSIALLTAYGPQVEDLLDICDEMGILVAMGSLRDYRRSLFKNDPPLDVLLEKIQRVIRRYRNHPCVHVWSAWFLGGFGGDENTRNPNNWLTGFKPIMSGHKKFMAMYRRTKTAMAVADPTRPLIFSTGVTAGDAVTAYLYPCFGTPIQEVESWPLKWRAEKDGKPMWVLESTFNYYACWYDMTQVRQTHKADNHVYKNAVRRLGPRGYFLGPDDDPAPFVMEGHLPTQGDTTAGRVILHDHLPPAFLETQLASSTRVVRAWRAFGLATITLGDELQNIFHTFRGKQAELPVHAKYFLPHEELKKPGPVVDWYYWNERFVNLVEPKLPKIAPPSMIHERFRDNALAPFIAFLAHQGKSFAEFTRKDHAYPSGAAIQKQVVLINDHADARPVEISVRWGPRKKPNAKPIWRQKLKLGSGEIRFVPFAVQAPQVEQRRDYELKLSVRIEAGPLAQRPGNPEAPLPRSLPKTRTDTLAIQVFPKPAPQAALPHLKIALYDEAGRTRKTLRKLGVKVSDATQGGLPEGANLLVVGRESLSPAFHRKAQAWRLQKKIARGALDLLVFEQTPASAPSLAPDLDAVSIRDAFALDTAHPIFEGLRGPDDFRNWRGDGGLIPPMPEVHHFWMPGTKRFMKWTNEGVVCSYLLRKPHYGNFRPLVEGGFDLWGAALLECLVGKGAALFCQLDVTGRADPAAQKLLRNLFRYLDRRAAGPKRDPFQAVYFLGEAQGQELLRERGVIFRPFDAAAAPPGTLIIAGAKPAALSTRKEAIQRFAAKGGTVLYWVDGKTGFAATLLPAAVKAEPSPAFRFKLKPDVWATRAISQGDLTFGFQTGFRTFTGQGKALAEPGLFFEVSHGQGRFLLAPFLRAERYAGQWAAAKATRLNSMLLTNLGVRQAPPDLTFSSEPPVMEPKRGRAAWNFEKDAGAWSGGKRSTGRAHNGKGSLQVENKGAAVWDRGHIRMDVPKEKGGIVKLTRAPWFRLAGWAGEAVFVIITVKIDEGKPFEFEYRCAAHAWTRVALPLAHFSRNAPKNLEGRTITSIKIRWGGLEDRHKPIRFYFDDIRIGPAPAGIFKRYPRRPLYDPNTYVTW